MLIIELNEFDPSYFKKVSKELKLKNIEKIFQLKHSITITDEKDEHQGLDPWVQWVSIHSGMPFKKHEICRLSETKKQDFKQIWNVFGKNKNYSCGIWGVMNAPLGEDIGIKFFVPDPWSFDEIAKPSYLNNFLSLPRYIAKNYLSIKVKQSIKEFFKMANFIYHNRGNHKTRKFFGMFFKSFFISGINIHTFSTLLDFLSTLYFIELKEKFSTNFNIIFLNHIAHIQHQFWDAPNQKISKHMKFGLIMCNEILGMLFESIETSEELIIINGIRQKFVKGEGLYVYRQKDPISFFKLFGIKSIDTEQNMTNDGILIFENIEKRDEAIFILNNLCLKSNQKKIFFVEILDKKRLFYQFIIENKIKNNEMILLKDKGCDYKFFDLIECICERTGAHIPQGDIFYKGFTFPKQMYNHEIYDLLTASIKNE